MTTTLTTEQATRELATIYDSTELAACDVVRRLGLPDVSWEIWSALNNARVHGRDWDWGAAHTSIERAYRLLGAEPPDVAVDAWHSGQHPLSIAIGDIRRGEA